MDIIQHNSPFGLLPLSLWISLGILGLIGLGVGIGRYFTRFQRFIQKLDQLDWGPILYKLMNPEEGEGLSRHEAIAGINRYRQFLYLRYRYPQASLVPDRQIDRIWHCHILDTEKYREDCHYLFGYFLDHFPYFGMRGQEDAQDLHNAFAETQTLFKRHFKPSVEMGATPQVQTS